MSKNIDLLNFSLLKDGLTEKEPAKDNIIVINAYLCTVFN